MNRRCAAHRCRSSLRQSDMTNLARLHEIRHCADGFFNRRAWIDAMLVIEVDRVNTEPLQARVATRLHVLGLTTDAAQPGFALSRTIPNFVARKTWSRLPRIALPTR